MNYDNFHKNTSVQKKIIKEDNFTYRFLLGKLNNYIRPEDTILDIGCGAGTLCLYFANKGHKVVGIDISESAILSASKSAQLLDLKNTKFKKINFPEQIPKGIFDFIIFTEVIEHIAEDNLAIKKIYQLLNSNGRVLISTPSINAPLHRTGYAIGFDKKVGHIRRYNIDTLLKMLDKNGFKVVEVNQTEGVLRNFLFLNSVAGKLIRAINHFSLLSAIFTKVDNFTIPLFGYSNLILVAEKK